MYQSEIEKLKAEAAAHRSKNAEDLTSSQTIAKPNVVRSLNMGTSTINVKRCFGCASIIHKEELFCSYCRIEQ